MCTGRRNKQILRGLTPNKKYYVDVFAIHQTISGFTFKLASTTLIFNRAPPSELTEDKIEVGKLTEFDKISSFSFRPNVKTNYQLLFANKSVNLISFRFKKIVPNLLSFNF